MEITERIVRACSEPGDLVLDPFAGSGATPKVARSLGRRWVGVEISPVYAGEAAIRVGYQQPSEEDSLASELIKHIAFNGKRGTLGAAAIGEALADWAGRLPLCEMREASVSATFAGVNSTPRISPEPSSMPMCSL